jgi:salicylate hydroxylase
MKKMISCIKSALKWKLLHFKELDKWTRGTVALLGDASHPTLPHQGQGAAMAVEDGAVIGLLLGKLQATGKLSPGSSEARAAQLTSLLRLYEKLRKERTETNVKGAVLTKNFYHMPDGPEQEARDAELANLNRSNWQSPSHYNWADAPYQKSLLGFDVLSEASERFDEWFREETQS